MAPLVFLSSFLAAFLPSIRCVLASPFDCAQSRSCASPKGQVLRERIYAVFAWFASFAVEKWLLVGGSKSSTLRAVLRALRGESLEEARWAEPWLFYTDAITEDSQSPFSEPETKLRIGCGRNSVAACSRRVRTAPLSSLTGLAWLSSLAPVPQRSIAGLFSIALRAWTAPGRVDHYPTGVAAIFYRPPGVDCVMAELRDTAKLKAILYCPAGLDFAPVLLRRPVRPTGAIDTSPPFQRWVR